MGGPADDLIPECREPFEEGLFQDGFVEPGHAARADSMSCTAYRPRSELLRNCPSAQKILRGKG